MTEFEIDLIIHTSLQYLSLAKTNLDNLRSESGLGENLKNCLYNYSTSNFNSSLHCFMSAVKDSWLKDKKNHERNRFENYKQLEEGY